MTWLLAFKLFTVPVLVALVSLAARRFGAVMGGLLMGLPWMTGPVLFFLTFEKGLDWFRAASIGATAAPIAISAFLLAYAWLAHIGRGWTGWPFVSIAGAATAFGGAAYGMSAVTWTPLTAAVGGAFALLATRALMPRPRPDVTLRPLPWWDIPVRMVAAGLMVLLLNVVADIASPGVSGVVASYPVILTSVVIFMHVLSGPDAVLALLRGLSLSLLAFIVFFSVATALVLSNGIVTAHIAAIAAGLVASAVLMSIGRRVG